MENISPQSNDIIFYSSPDGDVRVEVFFQEETFWLSQKKIAELFGVDVRTVNEHLLNIYKTNKLGKVATIRKFRIVQKKAVVKFPVKLIFITLTLLLQSATV